MTAAPLLNSTIYVGGHDFTADTNKGMFSADAAVNDATTFASQGWKEGKGGLKSFEASLEGFWASATADAVDPEIFPRLGVADEVASVAPTGAEGGPCYICQASKLQYSLFGEIGQLIPFALGLGGSNTQGAVRGLLAKAKGEVSATGATGTALQLGAASADQFVYAAVHVFGTPGTTITIKVQSDNASNFPSATDIATIGPLTAAGGTWMTRVAGPITDDWFRINVSAITGTFTIAGAVGVA